MAKDGQMMETVTNFIFLGSKITADGDYSHEIKRCSLLGRKIMTNLDNVLKSRHITFSTKVCLVKAMGFPLVMYRCENWTIRKAERQRTDAFKLWCWRRLLRVCQTLKSVLKEINAEAAVPILWPPGAKSQLIWKDPDVGKDWRQKKRKTAEDELVR